MFFRQTFFNFTKKIFDLKIFNNFNKAYFINFVIFASVLTHSNSAQRICLSVYTSKKLAPVRHPRTDQKDRSGKKNHFSFGHGRNSSLHSSLILSSPHILHSSWCIVTVYQSMKESQCTLSPGLISTNFWMQQQKYLPFIYTLRAGNITQILS